VNWISGQAPDSPFEADVKIRYKAEMARAAIFPEGMDQARVSFKNPLRDITAGQLAVFYNNDIVIGSGIIAA